MKNLMNNLASEISWEDLCSWQEQMLYMAKTLLIKEGAVEPVLFVRTFKSPSDSCEKLGEVVQKEDLGESSAQDKNIIRFSDNVVCVPMGDFFDPKIPNASLIMKWTEKYLMGTPNWLKFKEMMLNRYPSGFSSEMWHVVSKYFNLDIKDIASFYIKSIIKEFDGYSSIIINDVWVSSFSTPISDRPGVIEAIMVNLETRLDSRVLIQPYEREDDGITFHEEMKTVGSTTKEGSPGGGRFQNLFEEKPSFLN